MADWDTTNPGDSDIVSQYPANERDSRIAAKVNFGVDHHEDNDGDIGKHEVIQMIDMAEPTVDAGDIGLWNEGGVLKTRTGAGDATTVSIPSGSKMVFFQAAAPEGWTQDTSANDKVLRVVSSAGGGSGGSWTISGVSVNNHAITVAEMPSHNHGGGGNTGTDSHNHSGTTSTNTHNHGLSVYNFGSGQDRASSYNATSLDTTVYTGNDSHNHSLSTSTNYHNHSYNIPSQGSNNGHNHGLTANGAWRPAYINVIVCEKD